MWRRSMQLARQTVGAWTDDNAPSMGAAIAYYTVFSIAPLLLIVMAVAGFVWGREAVQGEIARQLSGLLGPEAARSVQALVQSADQPRTGAWAGSLSLVLLLVGATTVFAELQSALDRIWKVHAVQRGGWWAMLRARLLSLGFVLGLGFLLAVSLVISAGLSAFGAWAQGRLPAYEAWLQLANTAVSLAVATLLFGLMFKLMPRVRLVWTDVWVGAVVTAVLFEAGKLLIGLYLCKSGVASTYAAAGSVVVLLLWVYYSAQIFLLGAEFTRLYAQAHGSQRPWG